MRTGTSAGAQRARDFLLLAGETLLAPTAVLLIVAAGGAAFTMVVLLLPYLNSLPYRWFTSPETWGPILDRGALIVGAMVVFR